MSEFLAPASRGKALPTYHSSLPVDLFKIYTGILFFFSGVTSGAFIPEWKDIYQKALAGCTRASRRCPNP